MTQFLRAIKPLLPLIPLGVVAVALATLAGAWLRTRRSGAPLDTAVGVAFVEVCAVASVLGVLILTLPRSIEASHTIEWIPFSGQGIAGGVSGAYRAQMLANVVMFMPFGVFLPLRWSSLDSLVRVSLAALALSLAIEGSQFLLALGRQSSTTDVILNTAGAAIGFLLMAAVRALVGRRSSPVAVTGTSRSGRTLQGRARRRPPGRHRSPDGP